MACPSLRVIQLDAAVLDREMHELLHASCDTLTTMLPVNASRAIEPHRREIDLVMDSVLWTSRYFLGTSPGQREVGIRFKNYTPKRVALHYLSAVLLPYATKRAQDSTTSNETRSILGKLTALCQLFECVHYLHFLGSGGYGTLQERILGLRNWNDELPTIGVAQLIDREMLWYAFRDLILLLWDLRPLVTTFSKMFQTKKVSSSDSSCAVCGSLPIMPIRSRECGHVCCYWCSMSRSSADRLNCACCGKETTATFNK